MHIRKPSPTTIIASLAQFLALGGSETRSAPFGRRGRGVVAGIVAALAMLASATPGGATNNRFISDATCSPPTVEATSEGTPSAKLLSLLGVLRRPQTASDALPAPLHPDTGVRFGEGVYVKSIRRARVVAGTAYYLVPVAKTQCSVSEEVLLVTVEPLGQGTGGATVGGIEHGQLGGTRWIGRSGIQYGVVPDNVANVTLRYPSAKRRLRATVTVVPVDNLYVATVPPAARGSVFPVLPKLIVWRSRNGSVLKTFHSP